MKNKEKKTNILAYRSEKDRSYGLAGMSIALASLDAIDRVVRVSMDEEGPMVLFSNEFFWGSSQASSPKAHWHALLQNYRITTSLTVANVLSRCLVWEKHTDPTEMLDALYPAVEQEGTDQCSLEGDEVRQLFAATVRQMQRIFANPRVHPVVDQLSAILTARRTLSGRDLAEELHYLHLI